MFQKLTVGSDDDLTFISDTTKEPERVITEHIKMFARKEEGHKENPEDWGSKPFQIMKETECRRIMLNYVDEDCNEEEKERIRRERTEHMMDCTPCLATFSHLAFGGGQDYAFVIAMLKILDDATQNAIWDVANGSGFRTADIVGVKGVQPQDRIRPGASIFIRTGSYKLQGRVGAKAFGTLHVTTDVGTTKNTMECFAIDINCINKHKMRFFGKAVTGYLLKERYKDLITSTNTYTIKSLYQSKIIWSRNAIVNSYAKDIYESAFKYLDTVVNIAKYYCYSPSPANKADMQRGIGEMFAEQERPELSRHYDATKRAWKGELDFCTECNDSKCAINRYEGQRHSSELQL